MLKELIQWEGFDGRPASRTAYFNLTRYEIAHDMELETLEQRFKAFQENVVADEKRDMTPPEIREMLDIFKTIIKHAYGIRSQDGKQFIKNDDVWNEFKFTGAFDAFIFHMFEDARRADAFMTGIWPREMQEAAAKIRAERPDVHAVPDMAEDEAIIAPEDARDTMGLTVDNQDAPDDDIPSITSIDNKSWSEYNNDELLSMSDDEFNELLVRSKTGNNVPFPLIQIGMRRSSGGQKE